jgi:YVTN family beta-propeller protein
MAFPGSAHASILNPNYFLTDTLPLPGSTSWDYLTFDTTNHRLFITRGDSIDVLNTDSKKIIGTIPNLEGVHGVALAFDLGKGFVTEGTANRVTVFDLVTLKILTTVPTGNKPDAVVYDEATQRIFAANGDSGDLTTIDAKTDAVLGTIKLGGDPEFAAVDSKGHLYINLENKAQIAVVDTQNLKTTAHYNLAPVCERPTGLTIDTAHDHLFSTCANKSMLVVNATTGKTLDVLPIGQHSDAAVYDAETGLAFSSNGDGTLTVVGLSDDGHYKVVRTVQTKTTARTMALDTATHKIYLAAAETDGFDPPTEKHPEPRPHIKPDTFRILTIDTSQ